MAQMLTRSQRNFTLFYIVLLLLELICVEVQSLAKWHYLTKPLLLICLIVFFFLESKKASKTFRHLVLKALFFSLVGDVLLMFVDRSPHFFTAGLVGFLIAHIFYCVSFSKFKISNFRLSFLTLVLLSYAIALFLLIRQGLDTYLFPVVIYVVVILLMTQMAFLRKGKVNTLSYSLVFIGALVFLISDSCIAINKFYQPFKYAGATIMLTYAIAQYFIVLGLLKLEDDN